MTAAMQDPFSQPSAASPPPFPEPGAFPPAMPPALVPTGLHVPEEDKTLGMLCHLLAIFTGFLGPLILWLVKKDSSPFVAHHGREALNFQITIFLGMMGLMAMVFVLMFVFFSGLLLIPVIMILQVLVIVAEVMAAIAAQRGDWHRYPFCLRLV
jgi:uncharacterized Tic20 family protein